jgi:inward rectifier potassium channel
VRKGVHHDLTRDWYYYLIEGSWRWLVGAVVTLYVAANLLFGGFYWLLPEGAIVNSTGSYLDAFAFSVQTLFTIGYGYLAPASPTAHALVAVESIIGVLLTAVITGLVFAKVSRPRVKVLFSGPVLVSPVDGRLTLSFRVGNERGNEVLDASIKMVAMIDTQTAEGVAFRKLIEVVPQRTYSPVFRLSWVVQHTLDENSPLYPYVSQDGMHDDFVGMICLLVAHDGSLNATIHAQHIYGADDFRFAHAFVDVLEATPDGKFSIDYGKFHHTKPLDLKPPSSS